MAKQQKLQLVVNGEVIYERTQHPDDDPMTQFALLLDGEILVQTSVSGESDFIRCPAGRHWMLRTRKPLPCPWCLLTSPA